MHKELFEQLKGKTITASLDGNVVGHLKVLGVKEYPATGLNQGREIPFGVDFLSMDKEPLPHRNLLALSGEGLEQDLLALQPVGQTDEGIEYHAVFN